MAAMAGPELGQLVPALNADGFLTRLVPAGDEVLVEQLFVLLGDLEDFALTAELMLLPEVSEPTVLQLFVALPFEVSEQAVADLARFLLVLNNALALTGFGMDESNGWVYYRHMVACADNQPLDAELLLNTVWMVDYQLDRFALLIRDVAVGKADFAQGLLSLQSNLENWLPDGEEEEVVA
jgi:hypothetical protein